MCFATLPGLRVERQFAQPIIHQSQTAVAHSEFGKTKRLRSQIKTDQACWCGHRLKGLNRNSEMPKQISMGVFPATTPIPLTPAFRPVYLRYGAAIAVSTAYRQRFSGKPLKRLKRAREAMTTGLKTGVNGSADSIIGLYCLAIESQA